MSPYSQNDFNSKHTPTAHSASWRILQIDKKSFSLLYVSVYSLAPEYIHLHHVALIFTRALSVPVMRV